MYAAQKVRARKNSKAPLMADDTGRMKMRRRWGGIKSQEVVTLPESSSELAKKQSASPDEHNIGELMQVYRSFSVDNEKRYETTKAFRRMLSVERNPPVDAILQAGALPFFVQALKDESHTLLQLEAAWALTNIASTSRTSDVAESGAVSVLVKLLYHKEANVREQSAWCLANIAGHSVNYRDSLLSTPGLMSGIIGNIEEPRTLSLLKTFTWTASNLCRAKPQPPLSLVQPLVKPLVDVLHNFNKPECREYLDPEDDDDIRSDTLWALSYLSEGDDKNIEEVVKHGTAPLLLQIFDETHGNKSVATPTVRCLGNLVTGDDHLTDVVLKAGLFKHVLAMLEHPSRNVQKDTCWMLSNIAAGTLKQATDLVLETEIVEKVISLATDSPWDIKKEAMWTMCNLITTGQQRHSHILIQRGGLEPICDILLHKDTQLTLVVLEAIEKILQVNEKLNLNWISLLDDYRGIDNVENLQDHPSDDVYNKTMEILEKYFGEDEENENIAPETNEEGGTSAKKQFSSRVNSDGGQRMFGGALSSPLSGNNRGAGHFGTVMTP